MNSNVAPSTASNGSAVLRGLNLLLADTYALMGITHFAHWNVEGPGFFALHQAFEAQYQELFQATDEIAERVRARDGYAMGGLRRLADESGIIEFPGPVSARDYVSGLVAAHEKTLRDAAALRDAAGASDPETQDLAIERIQSHQKAIWMLKSYLKP